MVYLVSPVFIALAPRSDSVRVTEREYRHGTDTVGRVGATGRAEP
jgi:hypothetical protein